MTDKIGKRGNPLWRPYQHKGCRHIYRPINPYTCDRRRCVNCGEVIVLVKKKRGDAE